MTRKNKFAIFWISLAIVAVIGFFTWIFGESALWTAGYITTLAAGLAASHVLFKSVLTENEITVFSKLGLVAGVFISAAILLKFNMMSAITSGGLFMAIMVVSAAMGGILGPAIVLLVQNWFKGDGPKDSSGKPNAS
jgi:hypothetical protein